MTRAKKRVKTLAANGKVLYQVRFSKGVLRAANRSRFDIVGFAASTAFKRVTDFCRDGLVNNVVASILQEMLQESPRDGAPDVSSYWSGHNTVSAVINHHTTGKSQIANVRVLNNTDTPMAKKSPNSLNNRGLGSGSKKSVQQGHSQIDARSVPSVREHGKLVRTQLAAFFNRPNVTQLAFDLIRRHHDDI